MLLQTTFRSIWKTVPLLTKGGTVFIIGFFPSDFLNHSNQIFLFSVSQKHRQCIQ